MRTIIDMLFHIVRTNKEFRWNKNGGERRINQRMFVCVGSGDLRRDFEGAESVVL